MKTRATTCITTRKWLLATTLVVVGSALAAGNALSQQSNRNGVVLHEYFDPSLQIAPRAIGQPTLQNAQPTQAHTNSPNMAGQPPALSLEVNDQEPIFTNDGPLFDAQLKQPNGPLDPRASANQLDDLTNHVDPLQYFP